MRYHSQKPAITVPLYGKTYLCNHAVYSRCTLFKMGDRGLAVIQQRFDPKTKRTWWGEIDGWVANALYLNAGFLPYFEKRVDGLYPTVTVRQMMWALRMKPLPKEKWETVFDRRDI